MRLAQYAMFLLIIGVWLLEMLIHNVSEVALVFILPFSLSFFALHEGPVADFDVSIEPLGKCLVHILILFIENYDFVLGSIIVVNSRWASRAVISSP